MNNYKAIGVMSGTSVDGLDTALCKFQNQNAKWTFTIEKATTIKYTEEWKKALINERNISASQLICLHKEYGNYIGNAIKKFMPSNSKNIDFIASHGHTIFHKPEKGINFQLGDGSNIAARTGIKTISDFRSLDIALGGQGAPLVPIGDMLLFGEYDYCLNLGGFANISYQENNKRIAFDICPVNIITNQLASITGIEYDKDGEIAKKGVIIEKLLNDLNTIPYYNNKPPKSLSKEWLDKYILPLINNSPEKVENILRSIYEHIVQQIANIVQSDSTKKVLVTGGGAYNKFLIKLLKEKTKAQILLPDKNLIEFKEALIFAFLGVLRLRNEINCLASVTGALRDSSSGVIYDVI